MAFSSRQQPSPAGEHLRALADRLPPARYDTAKGRYTYIHTIGWNAVFDDPPDGKAQRIVPSEKHMWYAENRFGRISVTLLPAVYPNEESYRYWKNHPAPAAPTPAQRTTPTSTATPKTTVGLPGTSGPQAGDLPPGSVGPSAPLASDPAELTELLADNPFGTVREIYEMHIVPRATRAVLLRILAAQPDVEWRGEATHRAGRKGVAISVETDTVQQVLIFDPRTGALLAWDEVERPGDTVAGSTLYLGWDRVDQFG